LTVIVLLLVLLQFAFVLPDYYSSVSPLLLFFTLHRKLLSKGPHKQQQLLQQSLCGLTFATKKEISRNKKNSPFPKEKKKSTRRKHPKPNNSGQAANTKRQSKLPKKILWVIVSSHKQKHFVLMGFAQ
jgi:hypothetical protein